MNMKEVLPKSIQMELPINFMDGLEEIRIRIGSPTELIYKDLSVIKLDAVNANGMIEMLNYLSDYSICTLEEQLKQGYFTMEGGHRVGVAGRYIEGNYQETHMVDISALNIRIAHENKGCATPILPFIRIQNTNTIYDTLIISPPGVGKTTYLRDIIRSLSNGDKEHQGLKIGVVDERSEIAACYKGIPQNDLGARCDVMDNCPKAQGMQLLLRTMSPQVIAVDELAGKEEVRAFEQMQASGCRLLGTVHADHWMELIDKEGIGQLVKDKKVQRIVRIKRMPKGERCICVYDNEGVRLC